MAEYDSIMSQLGDIEQEGERLAQGNDSNDFLEKFVRMPEKEGPVTVRLLPPAKGKKFFCSTRIHKLENKNVHCPRVVQNINGRKMWVDEDRNNPCPICRYYSQLWKDADAAEKEGNKQEAEQIKAEARKIKPIERYYYNCIVRSEYNPKTEKTEKNVGPKILSVGKTLHQMIIEAILGNPAQQEPSLGDIANPKDGRDFKIMKKIKKGDENWPDYSSSKFQEPSVLGDKDQIEEWLTNLNELAELRNLKDVDEMKTELKRYLGLIVDDTDTSFDINEFRNSEKSLEDQVHEAISSSTEESETTEEVPSEEVSEVVSQAEKEAGGSGNGDEVVVDTDFFSDLQNV